MDCYICESEMVDEGIKETYVLGICRLHKCPVCGEGVYTPLKGKKVNLEEINK